MGVSNPTDAAVGVSAVLLFMTFSLFYIYSYWPPGREEAAASRVPGDAKTIVNNGVRTV